MKRILFPTDFSETSKHARKYAIEIAKRTGASIYALNVFSITIYDPNMPAELMMNATEQAEKTSKESLERICKEMEEGLTQGNAKHVKVEYEAKQGLVVDEIINYVEDKDIDIVIMGTTGAGGIIEKIIGSNTASVIEKTPRPVLAIPKEEKYTDIKAIVYATDLEESETKEISQLLDFAKTFDAEVTFLHICDEAESILIDEKEKLFEEMKKNIQYSKMSFELIRGDNIFEEINNYVNANSIDIIAMATHKRSLLGKIFNRSLTKKMAYHTHIPLLALEHDS